MEFQIATGQQFQQHINAIAALRISIFKEYPYLYDGDIETEMDYLKSYSKSKNSILIIVKDNQKVIGSVTGIPLAEADKMFLAPFIKNQSLEELSPKEERDSPTAKGRQVPCRNWIDSSANSALNGRDCAQAAVHSIFYLGEILLLKEYRGQGIGYQMYRMFEDLVRQKKQYHKIAIAEVVRDQHDPRKPKNYISVHKLWERLGYVEHPEMVIQASYKEVDSTGKIPHSLVYSFKDL